ncbi:MAG: tetratricopeptide repeat protein [Gemmatimonadota bacterium]
MRRSPTVGFILASLALGGCASKGDLRRVEDQLVLSRAERMRSDSARAAQLTEVLAMQRRILDSLGSTERNVRAAVQSSLQSFKGDFTSDLYNIQQQLVQVQALTGQSQQRLTELRTQLEARSEQLHATPTAPADTARASGATSSAPAANNPSADQVYEASLQQLRRGSPETARSGFREFLKTYSSDQRVPDVVYFIGESFAADQPDSAALYYAQVIQTAPTSPRAATSLYKLGLLADRRKDADSARTYFQRVVKEYPKSDEAALARDRLKSPGR